MKQTGVLRLSSPAVACLLAFLLSSVALLSAQSPQKLHKHVPPVVSNGRAKFIGRMPAKQMVEMSIVLPVRDQASLTTLLGQLYDPASPRYRQFLSVQQFTDQFGPTQQDYNSVIQWAKNQGLAIQRESKNRMILDLSGSVAQVNAALNVSMNSYQDPNGERTFYSIDREPTLNLSVPVAHIEGLNNFSVPIPMVKRNKNPEPIANVTGAGPGGYYLGSDMRAAYYGGSLLTGAGQSVGLLEFGGYRQSDVDLTFSNAGQTYGVPINNVLIGGASAAADSDDAEQVLDIVQAIGMAPGLSQVRVYIGTAGRDADIFNAMATENICKQLSVSWAWYPEDASSDDPIFQELAAQGQSVFVASGDFGAYDYSVSPYYYPAEDAYVTAVGATHLSTNYGGAPWVSESAWTESGGGISPDGIALPSWQQGIANRANGGSAIARNVPDVAMEGDFDNYYCDLGTCSGGAGGTSFAAPRWAAFMALLNQQAVETGAAPAGGLGFINPAIYSIGKGTNYGADFHDIISGNNDSANQPAWYSAVSGFDLVTGWGSPNGQGFIDSLAGPVIPGFWLSTAPESLPVSQGSSGTTTISVTDAGGFAGNVSLTASGLPTGVTASFSPSTTSGTSVLTLTASSTAAVGTATIKITGTSGTLSSSTSLLLTVNTIAAPPPPIGGFGSVSIGTTSNASTFSLTFTAAGTLNSIAVLTQGAAGLDFANAGGGTCAIGTAYAVSASCTVNVSFSPRYAGTRNGAIVLNDASGNRLAQLYLQGYGIGPQSTFNPGKQTTIGNGFIYPEGVAALGDGSLYVTDYGNGGTTSGLYLETLSNGNYTQSKLNCTFTSPVGVAVDGSGTIYVADPGVPAVYKVTISNGSCNKATIGNGLATPWAVAVDGSGSVYIGDFGNSTISAAVYKETPQVNGTYLQSTVNTGWVEPDGVAVDGNGNVYVADYAVPGVFKESLSGGSYTQTAVGQGWTAPSGIAVDGAGNVYVSETGNSIVYGGTVPAGVYKEVPSGGGSYVQSAVGSGWAVPRGVTADGSGNVYVADELNENLSKDDLADPPQMTFLNSASGMISSDSPKTVTISNLGTATLQFSSVTYAGDFPEAAGVPTDCTSSTSLMPGGNCTLSIEFLPTAPLGSNNSLPLSENVTITTNSLNAPSTQQTAPVSGTEVLATGAVMLSVSPDPAAAGTSVTFGAAVSGSNGGPAPTGTITLYNGTTPIAGPLALTNGVAAYSTNALPIGVYSIVASYSGDANYQASNSSAITESIVGAPGISNLGNTSIGNQNLGTTSSVIPLSITFSTAETLGSISVLTQGIPNLDFANAGGGTCAVGTPYAANDSCTVNITFTPKYSGARVGAVVLADNAGSVIGTAYLMGTGVGSQTAFLPGTLNTIGSGFSYPQGVSTDGNANLYVADALNAAVYKETLTNGVYSQSNIGSGFVEPYAVTVDGAGNIYIADAGSHAVYKETPANGTYVQTVIGYGFISPTGVAVDSLGNVYVADFGNGVAPGAVYLETLSNGSYTQSTIGSGFVTPQSLTVDSLRNVYVADPANGNGAATVYELTPWGGMYNQTTIGSGWQTPTGIAVDGNGNLYVTDDAYDLGNGFVFKETPQSDGSFSQSTLLASTATPFPGGVAVDGRGNLYVTDNFDGMLYRDDFADPPSLTFATTVFGSMSTDSPKTVSVENIGNAPLNFSAITYPSDFPEAPGVASDCTVTTSLVAGVGCTLSVNFAPASLNSTNQPMVLNETLAVTTNASPSAQILALSGTEATPIATAKVTVPANVASVGASVTFTATVTGQSGVAAPTGSVTFYSNGAILATATLKNGSAVYSTSSLAVGIYSITATYSGDQIYPSVTSSALTEQIIPVSAFGTVNVGATTTNTVTVTFASRVTLGSIAVVTQGLPNLDFTNAGGGTCATGTAYSAGSACTVKIAFKPRFSGARQGAIVLGDNKSNWIQTIFVQGTGIGPQLSFSANSQIVIKPVAINPQSVNAYAVDDNGNVYVLSANGGTSSVTKWTLSGGNYTSSVVPTSTLTDPGDIAVDSAGSVYVTDGYWGTKQFYCRLLKEVLVAGAYKESVIKSGQQCQSPWAITVDGSGNAYISDGFNYQILKEALSAGSYTESVLPFGTLYGPGKVAVDGSGNVFLSDYQNNVIQGTFLSRVFKLIASGGNYTRATLKSSTVESYGGPVVDGSGTLYLVREFHDPDTNRWADDLLQLSPSGTGYITQTLVKSTGTPQFFGSLIIDGNRNLFDNNNPNGFTLSQLDRSDPPSISFVPTDVGSKSIDSPQNVSLTNVGNTALTFSVPGAGTNPSISPASFSLDTSTCPQVATSGLAGTLNAGSSCGYTIDFTPATTGTINGSMLVTDNALNAVNGIQTIPLSGTGKSQSQMAMLTVAPTGKMQVTWLPASASPSNPSVNGIWVDSNHQTFVIGVAEFVQGTCTEISPGNLSVAKDLLGGNWTIPTSPMKTFALPNNQCPGHLYQFSTAYYAWGSAEAKADLQDPFVLHWTTPDRQYDEMISSNAEFDLVSVTPPVPYGSGQNPPFTATASLASTPANAQGYTWTIIGGGGAIVFSNGADSIQSTTSTIPIFEPNPTSSMVPFTIEAVVANPGTIGGALHYGPTSDLFGNNYVSCSPSSLPITFVARGGSVVCTATGPSGSTFSGWKFTDGSNTVKGTGTSSTWSGVMVTSGTVSVTVTSKGQATIVSTQIVVTPRSWHTKPATPTEVPNKTFYDLPEPPQPTQTQSGTESGTGESHFDLLDFTMQPTSISDNGPNNGYTYFTSLNFGTFDYMYEISPDLENTTSAFYRAQCGDHPTNPDGYISGVNLLTQTNRHEWNSSTQSHYAFYSDTLNKNNPGDLVESQVAPPGANVQNFTNTTVNAVQSDITAVYNHFQVQPFAVNQSETGGYLGKINYEVNGRYATCP